MNAGQLLPWRRALWIVGALTAVSALWGAPAAVTLFLLVLGVAWAAACAVHAVDRRDQSPTAAPAGSRLAWTTTTTPLPPPSSSELAMWSDQTLSQAWRVSYVRLRRQQRLPQPSPGIARVARERAIYLNEIERRYPDGFSAWMAAGARAPSDPTGFLVPGVRSRGADDR